MQAGAGRERVDALPLDEAAHGAGEVLHLDPGLGPHHADGPHQRAAHAVGLRAEDMLNPNPHGGFRPVAGLALFGQRLAALALAVDVAGQLGGLQLGLHLLGTIRRIRPHARAGVALHQQVIHRLAVVQRRIADMVAPHQLVLAVHVDVVLVAVMRLSVLARRENSPPDCFLILLAPARVYVLLAALGGLVGPALRHVAALDRLVLVPGIVVARHRYDGRIQNLTAPRDVSLPRQIAFAHTFFNLVVLAFFLLLAPIVVKALERIVPGESDRKQEVRYLNESLISTPYLALIAVIKELTVMLSICRGMLDKAEACIVAYNHKIKNELIFDEESVDEMQKNITAYLVEITRNDLTDRQRRLIPALLHSVNDLEKVGDYCENIVILAQRLSEENLAFSGTAREELERLFAKTRTMMKHTLHAVESNDREAAQITLTIRKEIDELIDRYKLSHVTRLETGACTSEPGLVFSDVLTDLDRINGHLLNITKGVLHMGKR